MASHVLFTCKYCSHKPFKSAAGLASHIAQVTRCSLLSQADGQVPQLPTRPTLPQLDSVDNQQQVQRHRKSKTNRHGEQETGAAVPDPAQNQDSPLPNNSRDHGQMDEDSEEAADGQFAFADDSTDDSDDGSSTDLQYVAPDDPEVCTESLAKFLEYVKWIELEHHPFDKYEEASIRLIDLLRRKRSTLDTYPEVMEWHLRQSGDLLPGMNPGDYVHYHTRRAIIDKLNIRYNGPLEGSKPSQPKPKPLFNLKHTVLPVSGAKVELIYHDARDCIVSLLTDPRFTDDDWQHFDNNPQAPPPDDLKYYGDTITSEGYLATHKELIKVPTKQIGLYV